VVTCNPQSLGRRPRRHAGRTGNPGPVPDPPRRLNSDRPDGRSRILSTWGRAVGDGRIGGRSRPPPPRGARRARPGESGLAEDPVHLGAANRTDALGHPAPVGLVDLPVEVTLFLALHAVAVVGLGVGHQAFPFSRPPAAVPLGGRMTGRSSRNRGPPYPQISSGQRTAVLDACGSQPEHLARPRARPHDRGRCHPAGGFPGKAVTESTA